MKSKKRIIIVSIVIGVIVVTIAVLCLAMMFSNGGSMNMFDGMKAHHDDMMQGNRGGHHGGHHGGPGMFSGHGIIGFLMHFLILVIAATVAIALYKFFTNRYQIVRKPALSEASPIVSAESSVTEDDKKS
jgi:hypothetical protein